MSRCRRPDRSTTGDSSPAGSATAECPLSQNRLVSVKILDGGTTEASGSVDQFVNLPEEQKWVADGIENVDRLTEKLRVKVRFDHEGSERFTLRFVPGDDNLEYSGAEKGRNSLYDYDPRDEQSYTTDGDGTKIINDVHSVAVGGGNTYHFEAEDDHGNTAQSGEVRVRRRVYLQEIKMRGAPCASSLSSFISEYEGHELQIIQTPSVQMDHIENVGSDSTPFRDAARTAYSGSQGPNKEPYCVAVAYTDHEAVKDANVTLEYANQSVGPGQGPLRLGVVNAAGRSNPLWKDIVTGEGWFVSASFLENGAAEAARVNIPEGKCSAVHTAGPAEMCHSVDVVVNDLTTTVKQGTIRLVVNVVNRMRAGLSFGGGNLICVCTRAWWTEKSEAHQNQVMIHEMGHKIGMVPNDNDVDRPTNQYSGSGHVGSHCHAGIATMANYRGASGATCVMFGATNSPAAFCGDCGECVKKRAIDSGWAAF